MRLIFLILLLSACDASPNVTFMAAPKVNVTVAGRDYTVWRADTKFEVVRHGWAKPAERAEIIATMMTVVEQVTNCKATPVSGDSGEMRGRLTACK